VPLCELSQTVEALLHHLEPLFPPHPSGLALARVGAGVELGPLQLATNESVEVLVFARFTSSPEQLVVYPAGSADSAVSV
jgi:hypothetical protein